jgi:PD-(D/E)XK nuclease superfamily
VGRALHWRFDERRLRRLLDVFVDLDAQARREHGVSPVEVELTFGRDRPFIIELGNGRTVAITGKVDRVDASSSRVVVIDYKTGAKRSVRDQTALPVPLQLPIYGLAARSHLGLDTAALVGEYWHLHHEPKKRGRVPFPIDRAEEEHLREVLQVITDGISAGIFVLRPDAPDPWRPWVTCAPCDPDGAATATVWSQWHHKRRAPELRRYIELVEPETVPQTVPPGEAEACPA